MHQHTLRFWQVQVYIRIYTKKKGKTYTHVAYLITSLMDDCLVISIERDIFFENTYNYLGVLHLHFTRNFA